MHQQAWLRLSAQSRARVLTAVAAVALTGTGGVMAVASLAPDAAELPVQWVLEDASPATLTAAPLPAGGFAPQPAASLVYTTPPLLYRTETLRSNDTADSLLRRLGVQDDAAAAFLRTDATVRKHLWGRAGRQVRVESSVDGLGSFSARWAHADGQQFQRLTVKKVSGSWASSLENLPFTASIHLASGTIQSSLFAATDEAGLPDHVATQIAEIFSGDIDFHRALRKGDRFSVSYEVLEADGEPLRAGRVLAAEFVNKGKTYSAMWFADATKPGAAAAPATAGAQLAGQAAAQTPAGAYYTLDGKSLKKAFLASPLEFSRVTSGFKMRLHPILQTWRKHLGVDYAAPTGTPVRTVSDGTVEFAGRQNGYGNVVIVDHGKGHTTLYAHLSAIHVKKGERVSQSQHIGAVGSTGWSTGPHLHFEFRVNGEHQDPQTLAFQTEQQTLSAAVKPQFDAASGQMRLALRAAASLQAATAQ